MKKEDLRVIFFMMIVLCSFMFAFHNIALGQTTDFFSEQKWEELENVLLKKMENSTVGIVKNLEMVSVGFAFKSGSNYYVIGNNQSGNVSAAISNVSFLFSINRAAYKDGYYAFYTVSNPGLFSTYVPEPLSVKSPRANEYALIFQFDWKKDNYEGFLGSVTEQFSAQGGSADIVIDLLTDGFEYGSKGLIRGSTMLSMAFDINGNLLGGVYMENGKVKLHTEWFNKSSFLPKATATPKPRPTSTPKPLPTQKPTATNRPSTIIYPTNTPTIRDDDVMKIIRENTGTIIEIAAGLAIIGVSVFILVKLINGRKKGSRVPETSYRPGPTPPPRRDSTQSKHPEDGSLFTVAGDLVSGPRGSSWEREKAHTDGYKWDDGGHSSAGDKKDDDDTDFKMTTTL